VIYHYRVGISWRDLPERFGDWNNIARRHRRWSTTGVWHKGFVHLSTDADNHYAMIAATIVRVHQYAAGAKGGTGKQSALEGTDALLPDIITEIQSLLANKA
jgi:transposase